MFFLGYMLALVAVGALFLITRPIGFLAFCVMGLGLIVPSIALQVRRFHDQDRSGWMALLNFIPYLGGLIVFVFMCLDGTHGPNRFGPDTKAEDLGDVFA